MIENAFENMMGICLQTPKRRILVSNFKKIIVELVLKKHKNDHFSNKAKNSKPQNKTWWAEKLILVQILHAKEQIHHKNMVIKSTIW